MGDRPQSLGHNLSEWDQRDPGSMPKNQFRNVILWECKSCFCLTCSAAFSKAFIDVCCSLKESAAGGTVFMDTARVTDAPVKLLGATLQNQLSLSTTHLIPTPHEDLLKDAKEGQTGGAGNTVPFL